LTWRKAIASLPVKSLPSSLPSQVAALQAQIRELEAQRRGVATQRSKPEALRGAAAEIRALEASRAEAQARATEAQAALAQAQRDRQRAETLFAEGAIAEQDLEAAKLEATRREQALAIARCAIDRLDAEIAAAQATRQRLQAELANQADEAQRAAIAADRAGQVLRVLEESERFVAAGTPLLELGNPGDLELVVDVLSSDALQIEAGDPVRTAAWGGDYPSGTLRERPLSGTVRRVEPSAFTEVSALGADEQRVNVIADFENAPANLGDGYRADAEIVIWRSAEVLTVPIGALFRCEPTWCVFVAEGIRARRQPVNLGRRNQQQAEVVEGLQEGDRVVLHPAESVREGVRLRSR